MSCLLQPKNVKPSFLYLNAPSAPIALILIIWFFNFPELRIFKCTSGAIPTILESFYILTATSYIPALLFIDDVCLICFTSISFSPTFPLICIWPPGELWSSFSLKWSSIFAFSLSSWCRWSFFFKILCYFGRLLFVWGARTCSWVLLTYPLLQHNIDYSFPILNLNIKFQS